MRSGLPGANVDEIHHEVFDLQNPNSNCNLNIPEASVQRYGVSGSLLRGKYPVICGGNYPVLKAMPSVYGYCWVAGFEHPYILTLKPRDFSSAIVLDDETLWVTGGKSSPKTSEFIRLNQVATEGPDLEYSFSDHSMISINSTNILITGSPNLLGDTLVVDKNDFSMKIGPKMSSPRTSSTSGMFEYKGKSMVIVAGGNPLDPGYSTSELWDPSSNQGWLEGKLINGQIKSVMKLINIFHRSRTC